MMSVAAPILSYAQAPPRRRMLLAVVILAAAVAPLIGFGYGAFGAFFLLSQNSTGLALLPFALHPASAWPMYLLAIWAGAAAIAFVRRPDLAPYRPWIRHGIFTGLALNLLYSALLAVIMAGFFEGSGGVFIVFALAAAFAVQLVLMIVFSKGAALTRLLPMLAYACMGPVIAASFVAAFTQIGALVGGGIFLLSPGLPLFCFTLLAPLVWRETPAASLQTTLHTSLAWTASAGTSLICAVVTYPTLRTGAPCYVATAASIGHRRCVGLRDACGMTRQLRTAICAEIALHQLCPQARHVFRTLYDRVGPALAAHITTPLRADIAHLIFKPIEGLAWLLLKSQVRSPGKLIGLLGRRSRD